MFALLPECDMILFIYKLHYGAYYLSKYILLVDRLALNGNSPHGRHKCGQLVISSA